MKALGLILASLTTMATALGSDTNILYLPLDLSGNVGEAAVAAAYERQVEAAKRLPECRPAEIDPEGHWGEIAVGLQLGVRFSTNTFRSGEPMDMAVILRNTTTNQVRAPFANMDAMELFVIKDSKSVPMAHWGSWLFGSRGRSMLVLPPLNQLKYYPYDVGHVFELNAPGVYQVFARCRQSTLAPDLPEVKSGIAEIRVIGSATK